MSSSVLEERAEKVTFEIGMIGHYLQRDFVD